MRCPDARETEALAVAHSLPRHRTIGETRHRFCTLFRAPADQKYDVLSLRLSYWLKYSVAAENSPRQGSRRVLRTSSTLDRVSSVEIAFDHDGYRDDGQGSECQSTHSASKIGKRDECGD